MAACHCDDRGLASRHQRSWSRRAPLCSASGATRTQVHLALLEEPSAAIAVFTLECPDGKFPSVGVAHPPAIRLERAIRDLYGLKPAGAADTRAWLDLGFWGVSQPLGANKKSRQAQAAYAFLPVEGEDLHQIPVGPVHAGIIEPGHFRFTANGEAVVRLEQRLGYVHKGIEGLMTGADLDKGAKLAGRVSGDSTVAYAIAFAQAVESALQVKVPERAVWLRALMAELERIANHFGDIGAICNDASFTILQADFAILRERVLARGRRVFRPSADARPHRPGRRHPRCRAGLARRHYGADRDDPRQVPRAGRGLRQHRLAARPHRDHRLSVADAGARFRRRRLCRPRLGPRLRCAQSDRLCALRSARIRGAGARRRRRQCARLDPHPRGRAEPAAARADRAAPA